mgnify:CR=1 FL=1
MTSHISHMFHSSSGTSFSSLIQKSGIAIPSR